jgi:hypothetical protein
VSKLDPQWVDGLIVGFIFGSCFVGCLWGLTKLKGRNK